MRNRHTSRRRRAHVAQQQKRAAALVIVLCMALMGPFSAIAAESGSQQAWFDLPDLDADIATGVQLASAAFGGMVGDGFAESSAFPVMQIAMIDEGMPVLPGIPQAQDLDRDALEEETRPAPLPFFSIVTPSGMAQAVYTPPPPGAHTTVHATQNVSTYNIVNVLQQCGNSCTQIANVNVHATSNVQQGISANATNAQSVQQASSGSGSAQGAQDGGSASTTVHAGGDITTGNAVNLGQAGGDEALQQADIDVSADTAAGQILFANSSNSTAVTQESGDGL